MYILPFGMSYLSAWSVIFVNIVLAVCMLVGGKKAAHVSSAFL